MCLPPVASCWALQGLAVNYRIKIWGAGTTPWVIMAQSLNRILRSNVCAYPRVIWWCLAILKCVVSMAGIFSVINTLNTNSACATLGAMIPHVIKRIVITTLCTFPQSSALASVIMAVCSL